MAKLVMDRHAVDNKYLHRDFHVSADTGLAYVGKHWGDAGVKEYLERFARAWYSPLAAEVKKKGFVALREHIEKIYQIEEAPEVLHFTLKEGELRVSMDHCPGIAYMRSIGYEPSPWYVELTSTVNRVIAEMCDLGFEMISYDNETGQASYRFFTGSNGITGGGYGILH